MPFAAARTRLAVLAAVLAGALLCAAGAQPAGGGQGRSAYRAVFWMNSDLVVGLSDSELDLWRGRGLRGFVVQAHRLPGLGSDTGRSWTADPEKLGGDRYAYERLIRDSRFVARCHARGIKVYLGTYLSNDLNARTPLVDWFDDAGWSRTVVPAFRDWAAAAKLLGFDGLAFDSEIYSGGTWDWKYPGNTHPQAEVRVTVQRRGAQLMRGVRAGFPGVELVNYHTEIPGSWFAQAYRPSYWNDSTMVDFWDGIASVRGYRALRFYDESFYKRTRTGASWDVAMRKGVAGVRATLAARWSSWGYARSRTFVTPFVWIDGGADDGEQAMPPASVAAQLRAARRWGEGGEFGVYAQQPLARFDYRPYLRGLAAATTRP